MRPEPSMAEGPPARPDQEVELEGDRASGLDGEVVIADGVSVVVIRGDVDIATAGRFARLIDEGFDHGTAVTIDLSGLEFIDSSGISVLVHAQERAGAQRATLTLRGVSPSTRRVFSISGLDQILAIEADPVDEG